MDKESQGYLFDQARDEIELILSAEDFKLFTKKFGKTRENATEKCDLVAKVLRKKYKPVYLKCLDESG